MFSTPLTSLQGNCKVTAITETLQNCNFLLQNTPPKRGGIFAVGKEVCSFSPPS